MNAVSEVSAFNGDSGGKREKTFFCAHTPTEVRPSGRDETEETETASRRGDKDESRRPTYRVSRPSSDRYYYYYYYYTDIVCKSVSELTSYTHLVCAEVWRGCVR